MIGHGRALYDIRVIYVWMYILTLHMLADIGLVGSPNVLYSTLGDDHCLPTYPSTYLFTRSLKPGND
jgi:hypothetical protein